MISGINTLSQNVSPLPGKGRAGPDAFLLGFETDYRLDYALSVGGAMQAGMDDEITLLSPSAYARYKFSNPFSGQLRKLRPYLQGGIGLNYVNRDVPASSSLDDDDIGFLMNFGFGTEYVLSDALSIGSRMLFNVTPTDVFDDTFYFSWEVTTLRYRF